MTRIATLALLFAIAFASPAADKADAKKLPDGAKPLFNGKDLDGWKNADKQAEFWKADDGVLHYVGKGGTNLITAKNYKDFEMWVDWKITEKGDSGIYVRGKPQIQIWDNKEGSGGLWNNKAGSPGKEPLTVADKKVGEWNTFYIKMVGDKVTVKLNDKLVVDNAVMLEGKVPEEGTIELQVHGNPLWFKNVYVRELESK